MIASWPRRFVAAWILFVAVAACGGSDEQGQGPNQLADTPPSPTSTSASPQEVPCPSPSYDADVVPGGADVRFDDVTIAAVHGDACLANGSGVVVRFRILLQSPGFDVAPNVVSITIDGGSAISGRICPDADALDQVETPERGWLWIDACVLLDTPESPFTIDVTAGGETIRFSPLAPIRSTYDA